MSKLRWFGLTLVAGVVIAMAAGAQSFGPTGGGAGLTSVPLNLFEQNVTVDGGVRAQTVAVFGALTAQSGITVQGIATAGKCLVSASDAGVFTPGTCAAGGGGIGGSIANTQIAVGSGSNISGSSALTYASGQIVNSAASPALALTSTWSGSGTAYLQAGVNSTDQSAGDFLALNVPTGKAISMNVGTTAAVFGLDVNGVAIGSTTTVSGKALAVTGDSQITGNMKLLGTYPAVNFKPAGWASTGDFQVGVDTSFTVAGNYGGFYFPSGKGFVVNTDASATPSIQADSTGVSLPGIPNCASGVKTSASGLTSCLASDPKFKDIIGPLDQSGDASLIDSIDTITFRWKRGTVYDDGGAVHGGFNAQNIKDVFPVAAYESGADKHLDIDERALLSLAMSEIKKLRLRVHALEKGSRK